jgi:hypothetical protein
VDVFAESLDGISILKKGTDRGGEEAPGRTKQSNTMWAWPRVVTAGWYRTAFFSPSGQPIPLTVAKQWSGRIQTPKLVLCVDSIFASRICKSLRLRVAEAILIPPTDRPQSRISLLFPETVIGSEEPVVPEQTEAKAETETEAEAPVALNESIAPTAAATPPILRPATPPRATKRKRGNEKATPEDDSGVQQQLIFEDTIGSVGAY